MIRITDSAAVQLRELLKNREEAGEGLRLMVEKGGCAGMQYAMKIGPGQPGDTVVEKDGVSFFVDAASAPYLRDCEVDYVDTLADTGFKIRNPHAVRSCGCGSSFEPAAASAVSTGDSSAAAAPEDRSRGEEAA